MRDIDGLSQQTAFLSSRENLPMHYRFRYLSLATATLLLSLTSPLLPLTLKFEPLVVQAQTAPTQRDSIAQSQPATKIDGTWRIAEARSGDGKNYTGTVVIQSVGQIHTLFWQTSTGNRSGIAFFEDGRLFVGWGTDEETGSGIVIYKIAQDGTLDGKWTASYTAGEIGTEKATGGTPGKIEGDYQVTGTNPGSSGRYRGVLNIRKTGETYQLSWAAGTSFRGVGVRSGDWLVVGWGQNSTRFGVTDYAINGDKANGRWASFNQPSLGVENLVRRQGAANSGNNSGLEFDN
jgi:hypothetical protein